MDTKWALIVPLTESRWLATRGLGMASNKLRLLPRLLLPLYYADATYINKWDCHLLEPATMGPPTLHTGA